jgi:hypothetical protein
MFLNPTSEIDSRPFVRDAYFKILIGMGPLIVSASFFLWHVVKEFVLDKFTTNNECSKNTKNL